MMARARSDDAFTPEGPIRSITYRLLWAVIDAFEKSSNACLYLAVGLLRQNDLRSASQTRWSRYAAPDESAEAGLEPWEQRLYFGVLKEGDRILLVGSGGGRDLLPFCARGYVVTGVELVPALAAAARRHLDRNAMAATLIEAPIETADLPDSYDVVIFSAFVYAYIAGSRSRASMLERLRSHLSPGGRIILSYMEAVPRARRGLRLTRLSGWMAGTDWTPEPEDTFSCGPSRLPFYERALSSAGVRSELTAAGFRIVRDEAAGTRRAVVAIAGA